MCSQIQCHHLPLINEVKQTKYFCICDKVLPKLCVLQANKQTTQLQLLINALMPQPGELLISHYLINDPFCLALKLEKFKFGGANRPVLATKWQTCLSPSPSVEAASTVKHWSPVSLLFALKEKLKPLISFWQCCLKCQQYVTFQTIFTVFLFAVLLKVIRLVPPSSVLQIY